MEEIILSVLHREYITTYFQSLVGIVHSHKCSFV